VFGWDFAKPQWPLSPLDASVLAEAATEPNSRFFFTHPDSRQAFLAGVPPISDLPKAKNPPVQNKNLQALFERARSKEELPAEWFEYPFSGRKRVFRGVAGEKVQLVDYTSDSTYPSGH
jgi:hypothetical protein